MNINYQEHLPPDFNDSSRVWIYQCNRLFALSEVFELETMLEDFVQGWKSHGADVKGYANLFFGHFIIIMADESATGVSGCSTDSSVRLMKQVEEKFGVTLFERQLLALIIKDKVQLLPLSQISYAVENSFISPQTLYFNNTVLNKKELSEKWIIPVKESWLSARLQMNETRGA